MTQEATAAAPERGAPRQYRPALMLVALILVAINLRLAITSASALLTALTAAGALTPATAVLIPAIPTAAFAAAGVSTARLAARLGAERTVALGMLALALGLLLRVVPAPWAVVGGTVVATGGLAIVNILLPAIVRAHFGRSIGPVTTAYTTAMSLGSALSAAVAVPVASALGSPTAGLAAWAVPAVVGLLVWLLVMPLRPAAPATVAVAATLSTAGGSRARAVREPLPAGTLLLASYFAFQALLSYVVMGWLPSIAHDAGLPAERSGVLLGVAMAVGVPATALVVPLSRGIKRMRTGFTLIALASSAGTLGLLLAPTAAPELWAALLGFGMCAFPLVLALIAGFGRNAAEAARVSTVVQSTGYTVATLGPLGAGALRQATGSWTPVLVLLIVIALAQGLNGLILTRSIARQRGRSAARPHSRAVNADTSAAATPTLRAPR